MMGLVMFIIFLILIFLGVPIAFSLGLASLFYIIVMGIPLDIIPEKIYAGLDDFVLLSIPGFILAGNLMNVGGITERIVQFARSAIGFIRGGLSLATVLASMVFGGISGTALAEAASIGSVLIPSMKKEKYDAGFASALTSMSSTIGPIIPPSVPLIIVGTLGGISIGRLFVAGIVPGIILGIGLMGAAYVISVKRKYAKEERQPLPQVFKSFSNAFWAIMTIVIILAGILSGIFTPTEASIIAVIYALIIGKFVYKELHFRDVPKIFVQSIVSTSGIMILVGLASLFGWILASEQIPQLIADTILSISSNAVVVIILINILLLIVGMFMETIAALVILFPILLPVAVDVGMDPVQFGVMAVLNLMIGLSTPPLGVCLFVTSSIGNISIGKASKAMIPFFGVSIAVLLIVAFIPQVTLFFSDLLN